MIFAVLHQVQTPELKELKPGEKIFGEWDQKVFNIEAGIDGKSAEPAKYRFVFIYYLSNNNYPNYAYSNEFMLNKLCNSKDQSTK